jgi:hypothetical protein
MLSKRQQRLRFDNLDLFAMSISKHLMWFTSLTVTSAGRNTTDYCIMMAHLKEIPVDHMPIICHRCAFDIRLRNMFTKNELIFKTPDLSTHI